MYSPKRSLRECHLPPAAALRGAGAGDEDQAEGSDEQISSDDESQDWQATIDQPRKPQTAKILDLNPSIPGNLY